jgi:hypothetical protein
MLLHSHVSRNRPLTCLTGMPRCALLFTRKLRTEMMGIQDSKPITLGTFDQNDPSSSMRHRRHTLVKCSFPVAIATLRGNQSFNGLINDPSASAREPYPLAHNRPG